jgi:hypothetical protein
LPQFFFDHKTICEEMHNMTHRTRGEWTFEAPMRRW